MTVELLAVSPVRAPGSRFPTLEGDLSIRVRSTDTGEIREIPITVAPSVIGDRRPQRGELGPLLREALSTAHAFPASGQVSRDGSVSFTF